MEKEEERVGRLLLGVLWGELGTGWTNFGTEECFAGKDFRCSTFGRAGFVLIIIFFVVAIVAGSAIVAVDGFEGDGRVLETVCLRFPTKPPVVGATSGTCHCVSPVVSFRK